MKKLSQGAVITANAISFAGAAIFGGIGIFASIANFTNGGWHFVGSGVESLVPGMGTAFFLALLGLICGLIAMFTLKKITNAEQLKKTYGIVGAVSTIVTVLIATFLVGTIIYALIAVGAGGPVQKELWLNSFLPGVIVGGLTAGLAFVCKQITKGSIKILPVFTTAVLCVASAGALLMFISTIVDLYADRSSSYGRDDLYNDIYDLFR